MSTDSRAGRIMIRGMADEPQGLTTGEKIAAVLALLLGIGLAYVAVDTLRKRKGGCGCGDTDTPAGDQP